MWYNHVPIIYLRPASDLIALLPRYQGNSANSLPCSRANLMLYSFCEMTLTPSRWEMASNKFITFGSEGPNYSSSSSSSSSASGSEEAPVDALWESRLAKNCWSQLSSSVSKHVTTSSLRTLGAYAQALYRH